VVPEKIYNIVKQSFLFNYLGSDAWLRKHIESKGLQIPSQKEVMKLLEQAETSNNTG